MSDDETIKKIFVDKYRPVSISVVFVVEVC